MLTIGICIATYNRKVTTLKCINTLKSYINTDVILKYFITDGGSTDGTVEALKEDSNIEVYIKQDFFWNRAMNNSISQALHANVDVLLLLNDDVYLNTGCIDEMISLLMSGKSLIVIGECLDSESKEVSYGRLKLRKGFSKLSFELLSTNSDDNAETFNGNCVLITASDLCRLGNLDYRYTHSFGDIDLGLRATKAGFQIVSIGEPVGYCDKNITWSEQLSKLNLKNWRFILLHPKGIPYKEWWLFCRSHGGSLWFVNFITRYFKLILRSKYLSL